MASEETYAIETEKLCLWYGDFQALHDVDLRIGKGRITSLIGPSGCGKTTLLRSVNRIVERSGSVRTEGRIKVLGHDVFSPDVSLVQLRKKVGMVFQRPNPLPLTIRDNVLFGLRLHGDGDRAIGRNEQETVLEDALRTVLLWEQTRDRLDQPAVRLSLEEQQKLCIARLLPVKPEVLLMDEPCSALDPRSTAAIEELIWELRGAYTILIVTHNMAQARRASEECLCMLEGEVVEHQETGALFVSPKDRRTGDYLEGRYG